MAKSISQDISSGKIDVTTKQRYSIHRMNEISDERGSLISLETMKNIPFDIKRIFYIFNNVNKKSRGMHAHRNDRQFLICLTGSVAVHLDDGLTKNIIELNSPYIGLLVENMTWLELHEFSDDCCLITVASEVYDESDYIRDYETYQKESARDFK